ncbi:hypothetical protein [Ruminococcus sp.]|uniref:hypothetical protein n=1 Tax=Ruminococcus sp. TaxID=41978 RepID=UPI002E7A3632|nr:hypothetical protein [Ruminococcus sp.]MEE1398213.1 hypothetical protein [Ruminococcus sp.]
MAYFYRWQYCDMDFLRHCLKQYSLLLEKIPSAILTEETTGTQMFVTGYLSDCIKRCDDGFDDYTMTALLPEGAATVTLQENRDTIRRLSTRYRGEYAALLPEMAAYYFSKAGRQRRRDTEQTLGSRCFAFFDYAYNRMLETQFLRHDFRWVGGEIPSVNHLETLSDAAGLTEALGQFRREEYDRRKKHDLSHAKLCTFLETQFGILYFENRSASYLLQPVSGGFSADDGSTESWLLWRCNRLLGGIALTAERKVCRLFGTDENERQQVLAAYFCFCRQKGISFSGEVQLCQPEYAEPLGKDFLPWKWESGKVTPQLLQTIADQLGQCASERDTDWCWLLGTRLVFTVLPLAEDALAALPQPERDAFFVQAEQFLRETATALGDQPQPLTEPNFEKLTAQYGKLLLVDSKEKLRRYARLYPTLACTKFPIRQKNGYVWLPEQPVRQSAKAVSDGITLPEIRRELLLKQLQLPPEKIALEQVYPLCYEDMGFFSENGSHRKRGEDFLKQAQQLLQAYEATHSAALQARYTPEEWDWFRQAAD